MSDDEGDSNYLSEHTVSRFMHDSPYTSLSTIVPEELLLMPECPIIDGYVGLFPHERIKLPDMVKTHIASNYKPKLSYEDCYVVGASFKLAVYKRSDMSAIKEYLLSQHEAPDMMPCPDTNKYKRVVVTDAGGAMSLLGGHNEENESELVDIEHERYYEQFCEYMKTTLCLVRLVSNDGTQFIFNTRSLCIFPFLIRSLMATEEYAEATRGSVIDLEVSGSIAVMFCENVWVRIIKYYMASRLWTAEVPGVIPMSYIEYNRTTTSADDKVLSLDDLTARIFKFKTDGPALFMYMFTMAHAEILGCTFVHKRMAMYIAKYIVIKQLSAHEVHALLQCRWTELYSDDVIDQHTKELGVIKFT